MNDALHEETGREGAGDRQGQQASASSHGGSGRTPYARAMDNLRFSDKQKEDMMSEITTRYAFQTAGAASPDTTVSGAAAFGATPTGATAPRAATTSTRRPMTRRSFIALASAATLTAAAAGVALATGLGAVDIDDVLCHFFGESSANSGLAGSVGTTLGLSASDGGVTITADAIVGCSNAFAVFFSMTKDDETAFDVPTSTGGEPSFLFLRRDIEFGQTIGEWRGGGRNYDDNPNDNALQFLITCATSESLGDSIDIHLEDLTVFVAGERDEHGNTLTSTIAEGAWDFTIPLQFESPTLSLEPGATLAVRNIEAIVTGGTLTPVSITIDFDVVTTPDPDIYQLDQMEYDVEFMSLPISLALSDGTIIEVYVPFTEETANSLDAGWWSDRLGAGSSMGSPSSEQRTA